VCRVSAAGSGSHGANTQQIVRAYCFGTGVLHLYEGELEHLNIARMERIEMMQSTASPAVDAAPPRKQNTAQRPAPESVHQNALREPQRNATDDEILGLITGDGAGADGLNGEERDARSEREFESSDAGAETGEQGGRREAADAEKAGVNSDPEKLRAAFEANPELRQAWDDAKAYRETFATPEEARNATALLADLNRMDALFYSRRPEDHAELARSIAELDPAAFASLAKAIGEQAARQGSAEKRDTAAPTAPAASRQAQEGTTAAGFSPAQAEFFQAANAAAVQGVMDAIETQVERLLPEGASKSARNRVVGEIYRELDATLGANRQLSQQVRDAFRSGALDANHQRAIVSLITGRARQALPGVAKRVMNEWTSTIVAANQDRRARQHAAERRVDIAGSSGGGEGRRSMGPRDIDYARMSDGDILNL